MSENLKRSVEEVKLLLETAQNGKPLSTIDNAAIILKYDPLFFENIRDNLFRERIELFGQMPWIRNAPGRRTEKNSRRS